MHKVGFLRTATTLRPLLCTTPVSSSTSTTIATSVRIVKSYLHGFTYRTQQQRRLHIRYGSLSTMRRRTAYNLPAIRSYSISHSPRQQQQQKKPFDWLNVLNVPAEDLPDPEDVHPEQYLKHAQEILSKYANDDRDDVVIQRELEYEIPEEWRRTEIPHDLLKKYPLPTSEERLQRRLEEEDADAAASAKREGKDELRSTVTTSLLTPEQREGERMRRENLMLGRYMEEMNIHISKADQVKILKVFVEVRMQKLIPTLKMYEHVFAAITIWADKEALVILLNEMEELFYPRTQPIHMSMMLIWMINRELQKVEDLWEEAKQRKFEIPNMFYAYHLVFLTRISNNLEKVLSWLTYMRENGKIEDPNPCNIVLELCRTSKLYDLADDIYDKTLKEGHLVFDPKKHTIKKNFRMQIVETSPRKDMIAYTYQLMAEICCARLQKERAYEFLAKFKEINKIHKKVGEPMPRPNEYLCEALIYLHTNLEEIDAAERVLLEMVDTGLIPSFESWKTILIKMCTMNKTGHALRFSREIEIQGHELDGQISAELMNMWCRVGDYRRAKNTYDTIIQNGLTPTEEARAAMMLVYAKAGNPGDAQTFYENSSRTGLKLSRQMHEIMIDEFLKRDFPGSAKTVLQHMKIDGIKPAPETIAKVALKYGELGDTQHVLEFLSEHLAGPDPSCCINGDILAGALSASIKEGNTTFAKDVWNKYSGQVSLNPDSAEKSITIFGILRLHDLVIEAFEKLKKEWKFKPSDPISVFEAAITYAPSFEVIESTFSFMKMNQFPLTNKIYSCALDCCNKMGFIRQSLSLMKQYVSQQNELTINQDITIKFFKMLHLHDFGMYKRDARGWLDRLVSETTSNSELNLTLSNGRFLPVYLNAMDPSQLVLPVEHMSYKTLLTGSEIDIIDILVHKYGYDPKIVQQVVKEYKQEQKSTTTTDEQILSAIFQGPKRNEDYYVEE